MEKIRATVSLQSSESELMALNTDEVSNRIGIDIEKLPMMGTLEELNQIDLADSIPEERGELWNTSG